MTAAATLAPGIHADISEERYHADPCAAPSLSSSIARILVEQSAMHARAAHPRLNPKAPDLESSTRAMDLGSAVHRELLGRGRPVGVVPFNDYKTAAARAARDAIRKAGLLPLLQSEAKHVQEIVAAVRPQIERTELADLLTGDGTAEATLAWQDHGGIWCRARIDWLPDATRHGGHVTLCDIKTTTNSAQPDEWARAQAFDLGADLQAMFYQRGLRRLVPSIRSVAFQFLVIETEAPCAVSVVELSGAAEEIAHQQAELAVRLWSECLRRDEWPGYPGAAQIVDAPPWHARRVEVRRLALLDQLARWQAPLDHDGGKQP